MTQPLVRHISLSKYPGDSARLLGRAELEIYLSCIMDSFSCLPHLTLMKVIYAPTWNNSSFTKACFPKVVAGFLRQASLDSIVIDGLFTRYDFQRALSTLAGTTIKRVHLKYSKTWQIDRKELKGNVVLLPYVESVHWDLDGNHVHTKFESWFSKPQTMFPNLRRCEIVVYSIMEMTGWSTCSEWK